MSLQLAGLCSATCGVSVWAKFCTSIHLSSTVCRVGLVDQSIYLSTWLIHLAHGKHNSEHIGYKYTKGTLHILHIREMIICLTDTTSQPLSSNNRALKQQSTRLSDLLPTLNGCAVSPKESVTNH